MYFVWTKQPLDTILYSQVNEINTGCFRKYADVKETSKNEYGETSIRNIIKVT